MAEIKIEGSFPLTEEEKKQISAFAFGGCIEEKRSFWQKLKDKLT